MKREEKKLSHDESCAECGVENCWAKGTPTSGEHVREMPVQGGGTMYLCEDCVGQMEALDSKDLAS